MKNKSIIILILLIAWCLVIFNASSKTSAESNNKSKELIYKAIKEVTKVTNFFHITQINMNDEKLFKRVTNTLNYPLRKCAHASVYFVLSILCILLLKSLSIPLRKALIITTTVCFLYSITDEIHQTFVTGRTGQFSDCLIDTLGAVIGSSLTIKLQKKKV